MKACAFAQEPKCKKTKKDLKMALSRQRSIEQEGRESGG